MKARFFLLTLSILFILSCEPPSPPYAFIDQPLQGVIGGKAWTYDEAVSQATTIPQGVRFNLNDSAIEDAVIFTLPPTPGLSELGLPEPTATLFDDSSGNFICYEGAIEILTVGADAITGRVDIQGDDENHVNGNFSVPYTP